MTHARTETDRGSPREKPGARREPAAALRAPPADARGGFTLLEVMVSLIVLAVGALAVARSMGTALAAGTRAGEQTRALALAVDRIELLKAQPASEVDDEPAETIDARGVPDPGGAYVREVEVRDVDEGARPNTKEVTVTVRYQAGEAGRQEVEIFTILFVNDT